MVKVRIHKLIITEETINHISKHKVTNKEIEAVIYSDCLITEGYSGKKVLTGRVENRVISVVVKMWSNKAQVITARDAGDNERIKYHEFEKQFKTSSRI